jgi:hypothetical protein
MERSGRLEPVPVAYEVDRSLSGIYGGIHLFRRGDGEGISSHWIEKATVLPGGCVVAGGAIHPASSCFRSISSSRVLRAARDFHRKAGPRPVLKKATLISRQLIHRGTWGDYFLEFLMSAAWLSASERRTVLADCAYVRKHAPADRESLGIDLLEIPESGIHVDVLEVVGPSQLFNNFEFANIRRMRERFPAGLAPSRPEAVYLSRVGVTPEVSKHPRHIVNEPEIETFLSAQGFEILRAHEVGNAQVRARLAEANLVIGSWGAAMLNLIWGSPAAVIELAAERAWSPTALKICAALNVGSYKTVCAENGYIEPNRIEEAIACAL